MMIMKPISFYAPNLGSFCSVLDQSNRLSFPLFLCLSRTFSPIWLNQIISTSTLRMFKEFGILLRWKLGLTFDTETVENFLLFCNMISCRNEKRRKRKLKQLLMDKRKAKWHFSDQKISVAQRQCSYSSKNLMKKNNSPYFIGIVYLYDSSTLLNDQLA